MADIFNIAFGLYNYDSCDLYNQLDMFDAALDIKEFFLTEKFTYVNYKIGDFRL